MDPLSISASIIALMQLSSTVIGYLSDVKSSHKEQHKIRLEICNTLPMLSILQDQAQQAQGGDEWSSTLLSLSAADGPIQQFREALERLEYKLAPVRGVKKVGKAFIWPFEKAEIQTILSTIERQKLHFSLARQNDHIALTKAIKGDVDAVNTKIDVISEGVAGLQCSEKHDRIRRWLAGPDPSSNYNNALTRRHEGTGSWLTKNDVFRSWKQDPGSGSMIWLYGIPGCGKTILCSTVLENVLQSYALTPNIAVLYFFFDFNDVDKQRPENMMRSLLNQLSLHCVNVPQVLEELYSSCLNGDRKPNFDVVLKTLHQMATAFHKAFIVLDALDECKGRLELLKSIKELISWDDTNLRILVTSRKEKDIEASILPLTKDEARVCIQSALVDADICAYVHDQLQTNRKLQRWQCKPEVQMEIESTLTEKANGMFRWVACQLDSLESCLTLPKLRKALATLPITLNETYARILCNIDEEYQQHALRILQWLTFSARPLGLRELAEVVAIDVNETPKFEPQGRLADPHDIVEICSSLVTLTSEESDILDTCTFYGLNQGLQAYLGRPFVRLAHFSVREYLTSDVINHGQAWKFSLQELDCHVSLAKDCLTYLLHFDVALTCSKEEVFAKYPLLLYATNYLTKHAQMAKKRNGTLCTEFFLERGEAFFNWIRLHDLDPYHLYRYNKPTVSSGNFPSSLYYASLVGLFETVKTLCDMGADVNAIGGDFETALIAASRNGHIEIAKLLLEKGAQVNFESSLLQRIARDFSTEILRLLLEHGADVKMVNPFKCTALEEAISAGHVEKAEMLLEHGAKLNIENIYGHNLLQDASEKSDTETVRLLLEHGAEVNIVNPSKGTALTLTIDSRRGKTETVRLLLQYGADVNILGPNGTALTIASRRGKTDIVRLLLEHGADVNGLSGNEDTALRTATKSGHIKIVEILLEYGANANVGENSCTALQEASWDGSTQIVRLLLEHGADVNVERPFSGTALQQASYTGHTEIVGLLLEYGADVNISGPYGTALQEASRFGHTEIIQLLLDHGADMNISGDHGTALQRASIKGYTDIVRLLLEHGADMNISGPDGTALWEASRRGYYADIVRLLLEHRADVNTLGPDGTTALEQAILARHMEIAEMLREKGAQPLSHDA